MNERKSENYNGASTERCKIDSFVFKSSNDQGNYPMIPDCNPSDESLKSYAIRDSELRMGINDVGCQVGDDNIFCNYDPSEVFTNSLIKSKINNELKSKVSHSLLCSTTNINMPITKPQILRIDRKSVV